MVILGHAESVTCTAFNMDGRLAATGALDGGIKVWDVASGNLVQNLEGPGDAIEVCMCTNSQTHTFTSSQYISLCIAVVVLALKR